MNKIWIKKSRKYLIEEYPEYYKLISESKLDDFLLYIQILFSDMDVLDDLELYENELIDLKVLIIIKIMNILHTRGINLIINEINKKSNQRVLSIILYKIKHLKKELDVLDIKLVSNESKIYLIKTKHKCFLQRSPSFFN